jgi:hypothetical protein
MLRRSLFIVAAALLAAACDKDHTSVAPTPDAGALGGLERPNLLPRPPTSQLPAELYPPDYKKPH